MSGGLSFFGEMLSIPFGCGGSTTSVVRFRTFALFECVVVEFELSFESGILVAVISPVVGTAGVCVGGVFEGVEGGSVSRASGSFEETVSEVSFFFSPPLFSVWVSLWKAGDESEFVPSLLDPTGSIAPDVANISRFRGVSHSIILKATVPKTFWTKDR